TPHAAGDEHGSRWQLDDDSRQQPARRAVSPRHDDRDGELEHSGQGRPAAGRLCGQPRDSSHPSDRRHAARHVDRGNHRHGARGDRHAGDLRVPPERHQCGGSGRRPLPGNRRATEVRRPHRRVWTAAPDGHVLPHASDQRAPSREVLMAIVTISFVIMLTGILGAYWLFVIRPEEQVQQAFWKRLKGKRETVRTSCKLRKKARQLSSVPTFDATLMRSRNVVRPLELLIEQSGNRITVGTFLLTAATCGAVVAYITLKLSGMLLLAIGAGALAAWVPVRILQFQRTRRVLKFEEELPE